MKDNDDRRANREPATPETDRVLRVAFVLEQHVGHQTYAQNLARVVEHIADIDARWIQVRYERTASPLEHIALPASLRAMLRGRHEVLTGLRSMHSDVRVFNTQVPAAIGGRAARRQPYVAITDVTPLQYDAMADGYGHTPDRSGPLRWWKHHTNEKVFNDADHCIAWSQWCADSIVDDYGVDPRRVSVVPPGIDTTRFTPGTPTTDETFRVLFVGGEFTRKGGETLLAAFERLPNPAELTLVTKSPLPRTDRVVVIDDLEPNDDRLIELFRQNDVFVLPTIAETFGIAAAEASAAGLPVVASDVGGLRDIVIEDETGLIVPVGDVDSLAEALTTLQHDRALRAKFGAAGRRHAIELFDADTNALRLIDIVKQCVSGSR